MTGRPPRTAWRPTAARAIWALVLLASALIFSPLLLRLWRINLAGLAISRSLLAPPAAVSSDDQARQALFQAAEAGLPGEVLAERSASLEIARLQRLTAAESSEADRIRLHTYTDWTRVHYSKSLLTAHLADADWFGAAESAEDLEWWPLAAYLYGRAGQGAQPPAANICLGHGRSLWQQGQPALAEPFLRCALAGSPANPTAQWILAQVLAQQSRWDEAAALLQDLARAAPQIVETPEGAALAASLAVHGPLDVPAAVGSAWSGQASNLVLNGSFESGFDPWFLAPVGGAESSIDNQRAHDGLQSFQVFFDGTLDVNYYQVYQVVPVQPGLTYQLSGQIWTEAFSGVIAVEVGSGTWWGGVAAQAPGSTGGWEPLALSFTVPAGIEHATLTLRRYSGFGLVSGRVWFDDIILARVGG